MVILKANIVTILRKSELHNKVSILANWSSLNIFSLKWHYFRNMGFTLYSMAIKRKIFLANFTSVLKNVNTQIETILTTGILIDYIYIVSSLSVYQNLCGCIEVQYCVNKA